MKTWFNRFIAWFTRTIVAVNTFVQELILYLIPASPSQRPKISLLIPFSSKDPVRQRNFQWLLRYWTTELSEAEVIIGTSHGGVFCKSEALNNAAKRSTGRVLVILDADAYLSGEVIDRCADRILEELGNGLWYVPYRRLYRLTEETTQAVVDSDPATPLRFQSPPPLAFVEDSGLKSSYGHRYGAMCMIIPREALDTLGCFDERFDKGWGGEDVSMLRALDTLYGRHKTTDNDIYHLWHPVIGDGLNARAWAGQQVLEGNMRLTNQYNRATNQPSLMRALVDEGCACMKK